MKVRDWMGTGAAIGALLFVVACSGGGGSTGSTPSSGTTPEPSQAQAPAGTNDGYQAVTVADAGWLAGVVKFGGPPPSPKKLEVTKDREICAQKEHYSEDLVVSESQGLANVVVSLTDIRQGKGFDVAGGARLDQNQCQFVPHVQVVPAGRTVEVYNNDGILHNIHTFSEKNRPFNKAQPKFLKKVDVEFLEPEAIRVTCDAHGWMSAWIVVADHPYYAVTDESGQFRLDGVPPGTYTVKFWHEKLGEATSEVTVEPGAGATVEHTFPAG